MIRLTGGALFIIFVIAWLALGNWSGGEPSPTDCGPGVPACVTSTLTPETPTPSGR